MSCFRRLVSPSGPDRSVNRYAGLLLLISSLLLIAGCDHLQPIKPAPPGDVVPIILVDDLRPGDWPRDPAHIEKAEVFGDVLSLRVSYSGGCREHGFQLIASRQFMESYPLQVSTHLAHDAHGDACEALIVEDLLFDLTPLKKFYQDAYRSPSGTLLLRLASLEIRYEF